MRFPVRGGQLAMAVAAHRDAAIDDRDQMGVGDQVQRGLSAAPLITPARDVTGPAAARREHCRGGREHGGV